jgi:hypothetical protein
MACRAIDLKRRFFVGAGAPPQRKTARRTHVFKHSVKADAAYLNEKLLVELAFDKTVI